MPLLPALTSSGLHFSSTRSSLDICKEESGSYFLFWPCLPPTAHIHPAQSSPALTPLPSFRDPYVLCHREWNFLVTSHHHWPFRAKSHIDFPSTQLWLGPWKGNRNVLVPSTAPFLPSPFPSPLLFSLLSPPTLHFCPLSFVQNGC